MDGDGVRLEIELGSEDDEFLREAVGMGAEEMLRFEVCFLNHKRRSDLHANRTERLTSRS